MNSIASGMRRPLVAVVAWSEARLSALYGSRYNPVHHSGALLSVLLTVLLTTGLYLLLFYRVGAPYESIRRITEQAWGGRWIRSLHRFASDAAVVLIVVHALKMFVQGRSWGPRALAWVTGVLLLSLFLLCGWTGYVMVWDLQAQVLASEGARILDLLPILSEPLSRTFVGEGELPQAFFFMNLFLHVALPIGLGVLLWVHVARVSRPRLMPPMPLAWGMVMGLIVVSVLWPVAMAPQADLFRLPEQAPFDLFFSFWIPVARVLSPAGVWLLMTAIALLLLTVPLWAAPLREARPLPAVVDERLCTGCEQCAHDCPYEAIEMIERTDGRAHLLARVDASLCVSCGICAGSCAPMVIGPPGRTGRAQLTEVKQFIAERTAGSGEIVILACTNGAGGLAAFERFDEALVMPVICAGSVHTSVIEHLLRSGTAGVLVASCPIDDCTNREGGKWLGERLYHEREAELQARVDRRRVRWVAAGGAERSIVMQELRAFRRSLPGMAGDLEGKIDLLALCERASEEAVP